MKRAFAFLLIFLLLAGGCGPSSGKKEATVFAMDTLMALTAYGNGAEAALNAAKAEIARLDSLLSAEEGGFLASLNAAGGGECGEELGGLIAWSLRLCELTGGAFDITVRPLMELWGFGTEHAAVPSAPALAATLRSVGYGRVSVSGGTLDTGGGEITLGGVAKGYASDVLAELFEAAGVGAVVSLGGNVRVAGSKPDGSAWKIAVRDPAGASYLGALSVRGGAVVTSGGYERYFEEGGRTYHHILDPETGYPADSGLLSATVVCASGTEADALSTAFFVMGLEKSLAWLGAREGVEAVFVTADGRIVCTKGLRGAFEQSGGKYSLEFR